MQRTWLRTIRIKIGSLDIQEFNDPSIGGWDIEVHETNQVWTNTRRFYRSDFMFFRWIYKIFSSHNLTNQWWERCETENPLEEINPGDNYEYLLPFIAIAHSLNRNESLELWNFAYNLYMTITPKTRHRTTSNAASTQSPETLIPEIGLTSNANTTQNTNPNIPATCPLSANHTGLFTYQAMANLRISDDSHHVHQDTLPQQLPSASQIGLNLGFVESVDEN